MSNLRVVPFEKVKWLLNNAGPQFARAQKGKKENGNDNSRSGMAFALACRLFRAGKSREYVKARLLSEPGRVGAWTKTKGSDRGEHELNNVLDNAAKEATRKSALRNADTDDEGGSRFRLLRRSDYRDEPLPVDLFDGLLPEQGVALLVGPSQSLKSFIAIELCLSVATGEKAFGTLQPRRPGASCYIAGEGQRGIKAKRIPAWEQAHDLNLSEFPFYVVENMPLAAEDGEFEELADEIEQAVGKEPVRIIILDTLNCIARGLSENDPGDMALVMAQASMLAQKFNCVVVVIHHPPKSANGERVDPRGSSALFAAADVVLNVKRETDLSIRTQLSVAKQKDDTTGRIMELRANSISLGKNAIGQQISSLVLRALSAEEVTKLKSDADDMYESVVEALVAQDAREGGRTLTSMQLVEALLDMEDDCEEGRKKEPRGKRTERLRMKLRRRTLPGKGGKADPHFARFYEAGRWRLPAGWP